MECGESNGKEGIERVIGMFLSFRSEIGEKKWGRDGIEGEKRKEG